MALLAFSSASFVIGCVAIAISGVGHALFHPAQNESDDSARLVGLLTEERATLASVPASFDSALGYQPVAMAGNLVDPKGGCSTPGRIGPESFDTACRTHDLGYDVLRFAEAEGDRLGAWARFDLDLLLYTETLETCETFRCRATATAYYTAVTANSIRQGYKAPTKEPTLPWLGVVLIVLGLALIPPVGSRRRHHLENAAEDQLLRPRIRDYSRAPGRGRFSPSQMPALEASTRRHHDPATVPTRLSRSVVGKVGLVTMVSHRADIRFRWS